MRTIIISMAALALVACAKTEPADPTVNDAAADMAAANAAASAAAQSANAAAAVVPAALASINSTTWEFIDTETKKPIQESVDASGKYIAVSGKEHIDHGTAVMKDGKACFTSAMTKEGEVCWTDPMLAIGASGETTSDKGEKITVKRTEYVPLTM